MIKVIFVCLGNICRSPMGEAVFRKIVRDEDLNEKILVDSAGTSDWHIGEKPHEGTLKILEKYNIPAAGMRGRQYTQADLNKFDYIIAMDQSNVENMAGIQGTESNKVIKLLDLLEDEENKDVPDPYFTGDFDETYRLVTAGCQQLLKRIKQENNL